MLKYSKFVVTENQLLCRMLFYKCRNIIPIEHARFLQDEYTGKLHHTVKAAIELRLENKHQITHNKKSFDMLYRYDHDEKCFHASLMGFAIKKS